MRRAHSIVGSLVFLLLAPGVVAGLVPWCIAHWRFQHSFFGIGALRIVGAVWIIAGIPVLLDSFVRFAVQGLGTPAPVLPTEHLVVTGLYLYVRNPMYLGVAAVIFGQALLFGSIQLLAYGLVVSLTFHAFVVFYEEPTLTRSFGDEYRTFCKNVPRWIPRLRPWTQACSASSHQ